MPHFAGERRAAPDQNDANGNAEADVAGADAVGALGVVAVPTSEPKMAFLMRGMFW